MRKIQKKPGYTRVLGANTQVYSKNTQVYLGFQPKISGKLRYTGVETGKLAVETGLSQQLLETGVETGQQLLRRGVSTLCLNSRSTFILRPCIAVSQPYAGVFLNAVPKYEPFRVQSWALRIVVQKRLVDSESE